MTIYSSDAAPHIETLIRKGADPNHKGPGGKTPLMEASCFGNAMAVKTLLHHGADPDITDDLGHTAQDIAKARQQEQRNLPPGDISKLLISSDRIQSCMDLMTKASRRNHDKAMAETSMRHAKKIHDVHKKRRGQAPG